MVNQTDPIIAIWRYLHEYRGRLDVGLFLRAVNDFFINPSVADVCINPRIRAWSRSSQDPGRIDYYHDGDKLDEIAESTQIRRAWLEALIEPVAMHYVGAAQAPASLMPPLSPSRRSPPPAIPPGPPPR